MNVSDLLHQLPYDERHRMTESEQMEFMTYLRPVLKEDVFPELHNGWKFLQSHIYSKNLVFQKVLNQRHKQELIIGQKKAKSEKLKKRLG